MYHVGQEMAATRGCLDAGQFEDSVSDRGRALDNVSFERLCRRIKCEVIFLKQHGKLLQIPTGLTAYIDFFNHERPHQSLSYRTTAEEHFVLCPEPAAFA